MYKKFRRMPKRVKALALFTLLLLVLVISIGIYGLTTGSIFSKADNIPTPLLITPNLIQNTT